MILGLPVCRRVHTSSGAKGGGQSNNFGSSGAVASGGLAGSGEFGAAEAPSPRPLGASCSSAPPAAQMGGAAAAGVLGRPLVVELALQQLMARPSKVRRFNINGCAPGALLSLRLMDLRLFSFRQGRSRPCWTNQHECFGNLLKRYLLRIELGVIMQSSALDLRWPLFRQMTSQLSTAT